MVAGRTESIDFPLARPMQPSFAGGQSDAFFARLGCAAPPADLGNTLLEVKSAGGFTLTWGADGEAAGYVLRSDTVKSGPLATLAAEPSAAPLEMPLPPEPLVFYRIAGANCYVTQHSSGER